jgi:hypothetical protein
MKIRCGGAWLLVCVAVLVVPVSPSFSKTHCESPVSEEDIQRQCDHMIAGFKLDPAIAPILEDEIVEDLVKIVNIGDKGTFGEDGAYRVNRIEIRLFGESESGLYIDRLIELGDQSDGGTVLVKACQGKDEDKPGDFYVTASIQIFLKEIEEKSMNLWAKDTVIYLGEKSTLSFKLYEAECPRKGEAITLRKDGPGYLPDSVVTDDYGRARTQFRAEKKGEVTIEALYEDQSAEVKIRVRPIVLWDLDCSVYSWQYDPDYPRTGWNDDHWRSEVSFVDIPLTQLAETDFTVGDPESTESPEKMALYMRWLRIQKFYESSGTFYDSRFTVYDGEVLHYGKAEADPVWVLGFGVQEERFDYTQRREDEEGLKQFILFKLKPGTITVSISEKAGVKTPWSEEFERRVRFPREEILAGKPFMINYEEPGDPGTHEDVEIRFTPREIEISASGGVP